MCVAFHVVHLALPEKEGSFKIRCFFRLLSISTSLASISTSLERLSISFFLLFTLFSIFVAFALFFCHRRTVITIVWHSYTTRCSFVRVKISDKAYLHYNMWCILPLAFVMIDFSLWYCFPVEWKNAMLVGFALCVWNLAAHIYLHYANETSIILSNAFCLCFVSGAFFSIFSRSLCIYAWQICSRAKLDRRWSKIVC